MIRKIFKVTLLLLLVAVCGVGYLGWSRVKNSRDCQKKDGGSRRGCTGAESGGDGK